MNVVNVYDIICLMKNNSNIAKILFYLSLIATFLNPAFVHNLIFARLVIVVIFILLLLSLIFVTGSSSNKEISNRKANTIVVVDVLLMILNAFFLFMTFAHY